MHGCLIGSMREVTDPQGNRSDGTMMALPSSWLPVQVHGRVEVSENITQHELGSLLNQPKRRRAGTACQ